MPTGIAKSGKRKSSPRVARIRFNCIACGAEREYTPSTFKQVSGKYCSKSCAAKNAERKPASKISLECEFCREKFERWPSEIREGQRVYCSKKCFHSANPSTFSYAEWTEKNRDKVNEKSREWRRNNQDKRQATQLKFRGRGGDDLDINKLVLLLKSAEGVCTYCGSPGKKIHGDHVIPISKGGSGSLDNILPCCGSCNVSKGKKDLDDWLTIKNFDGAYDRIEVMKMKRAILAAQGIEIRET